MDHRHHLDAASTSGAHSQLSMLPEAFRPPIEAVEIPLHPCKGRVCVARVVVSSMVERRRKEHPHPGMIYEDNLGDDCDLGCMRYLFDRYRSKGDV